MEQKMINIKDDIGLNDEIKATNRDWAFRFDRRLKGIIIIPQKINGVRKKEK